MSKVVVLNADLINYDNKIDFSSLGDDLKIYGSTKEDEILDRIQGAEIVVAKEMPMSKDLIEQFPDTVKMVVEGGTGYNNWNIDALNQKGIKLTNIPAYSTQRVADTAIMMMLSLASSLQQQIRMIAAGNHDNFDKHLMVSHEEINGKTLGVFGYGHIGRYIIKVAKAMDMKVLVSTRTKRDDIDGVHFTDKETVLKNSDFISLNLPLVPQTKHMINAETLKMMKPSAYLINTARGGLVDEKALIEALNNHEIAGAGLDVQEHEPLADDSPLFKMDNVIVTPHMGWRGLETRQRLVNMIGDNVKAFLDGKPINLIN